MTVPESPQEAAGDQDDTAVDSWVAHAKWATDAWSNDRYADYLRATGEGDPVVKILIRRLSDA